jgi:hypothetical protein
MEPDVMAGNLSGAAFESSGALPENVNYAVKSSFLLKLTGIRAGSVRQAQSAEYEGPEV